MYAHCSLRDDVECDDERSEAKTEAAQRHDHQPQRVTSNTNQSIFNL